MIVKNIESGIYEGYVWYSDQTQPMTLIGEKWSDELDATKNPFIVEAQLYDKERKVSYSVKYVDGRYVAHRWDNVSREMENDEYSHCSFFANRVGKDKGETGLTLHFVRHWAEENDSMCAISECKDGMPVLQPKELIFVGF